MVLVETVRISNNSLLKCDSHSLCCGCLSGLYGIKEFESFQMFLKKCFFFFDFS